MTKFELVRDAFLGNLGESIPFSLWRHHPEQDRTPQGLAEAEIAFHKKYDHDLLKISFHGRYPVVDWGCDVYYDGALSGSTACKSCRVKEASDWEVLEAVDVNSGEFGRQVQAVELIHKYAQDRVPTLATIFDPPMVAEKLCEASLTEYFESHPKLMERVLEMITKVMIDFAKATLDAGADGLFIASQHSTESAISDKYYTQFVLPSLAKMITRLRGRAKYIVLHLHAHNSGEHIRFKHIVREPGVSGVNWEDQSAALSLKEGKRLFRKTVLGGLDHRTVLRTGSTDDVEDEIKTVLREAGPKGVIIAPGCVIRVDTPDENLQAVVDTIRSIDPYSDEWEA
ncbi:MAG: hypothetical protein K9W43_07760 [Candidatus Thorarchaeota archaeon]|nr:hypothetical protein [Candidatus Thorarchaeota archaeon]